MGLFKLLVLSLNRIGDMFGFLMVYDGYVIN